MGFIQGEDLKVLPLFNNTKTLRMKTPGQKKPNSSEMQRFRDSAEAEEQGTQPRQPASLDAGRRDGGSQIPPE